MVDLKKHPILIIDFGSQYTQLIARRIRELGVYCEMYSYHMSLEQFHDLNPCGIILSGGPSTVTLDVNPRAPEWVFSCGLPVLGICYGMQTMAVQLGGVVETSSTREFGYAELTLESHSVLLDQIQDRHNTEHRSVLDVWMSHGDKVTQLPPGFEIICSTENAAIAGMSHEEKKLFALQFHPEVTHTYQGVTILKRFVIDLCHAQVQWTSKRIVDESIDKIKKQIGSDKVLLGLSGGVDSSVVAALLHKAIGKQLVCVFVDTGLLRLHEVTEVEHMFSTHWGIDLITVHAEEQFLTALQGITCPEEKRKIIGRTFIEIFEQQALSLPGISWLAQGTIYPDVIESAMTDAHGASVVIKSHHNVGGLPDTLNLKLIEPIRELFKDEVRKLGAELGLPESMINRHPFPGPGLGVRILGEIKKEFADILRQADAIYINELKKTNLYQKVSQAFAVFLPVKSVGVMGDGRKYDYVICLRAVETVDFMTAHWSHLPWDFLAQVSNRIINEVNGVSRVTYDISGKPPATIEWE